MPKLLIFAASPSDTAAERARVEKVVAKLEPLAEHLDIVLKVRDWSTVVPNMGRAEQVILDQLDPESWGVFIGILWHRFGTPPAAHDPQTRQPYMGGTEEEFKTAYRLWKQHGKPRIMMYRCVRPIPPDALDPDQFKRVREFFAEFEAVEGEHPGLYQSFDTTDAFEDLLFNNLQRLLLDYGEQISGKPVEAEVVQAFTPKIPDNLPRRAPFFGRDKEMAMVLRAVSPEDRTWGILLDGIGGIGKSALAVEAAYRCKDNGLFDAFIFVSAKQNILDPGGIRELKPAARTLNEFLNETAHVLGQAGIAQLAGDDKRRALLDELRATRALLIYDNLETLAKEEQEALADFLRELPQACKAIITSRRRGGEGAVWLRLEKLEWDAVRDIIKNEIARDRQLANKLESAGERRWQDLYDETKGSPLALMHTLGLMRVRAGLTFEGALEMLCGNRSPDLQKFIFQEARKELTTNDESALRALSFFAPSATFEAWMKVSDLSRNALETTIDRLSALSLIDMLAGEERYALHPLTRNFVRDELLANAQTARAIGLRFAEYWVAYANQYGGRSKESYKTYHRIEAEWTNLSAAAEWLWQTSLVQSGKVGDEEAARKLNDLANGLCPSGGPLFFVGRWDEILQLGSRTYEVMNVLKDWSAAGWRAYQVTWIYYSRANTGEASRWADRCSEAMARGGGQREQAASMYIRALLAEQREEYKDAEQLYQEALEIYRALNMDEVVPVILGGLGSVKIKRKEYDAADKDLCVGLAIAEKRDLKEEQAFISGRLGLIELERKRWKEARKWFDKELYFAQEVGRHDLIAYAKHDLARLHEAEGHLELALAAAQAALEIRERLRHANTIQTQELIERLKKNIGNG